MATRGKALVLVGALMATLLGACGGGGSTTRTVQVDYRSDDFAGTFRGYFPRNLTVKPGMTVNFHQTWSGEPHTVTFGTLVDEIIQPKLLALVNKALPNDLSEDQVTAVDPDDVHRFESELPFFFGDTDINQTAGRPCFLDTAAPPTDGKPCPKRAQPAFTGRQRYYNSGFIPYLGTQGNEFSMKIASNAKPGTYFYYCALHGPGMGGLVTIRKSGTIPSQADVNRQAKRDADRIAKPLLAQLRREQAGNGDFKGNLAGSGSDATFPVLGQVNEFTPRTVQAKVGQPVTWTFIGNHTISFNVPAYVPFYSVQKNGNVVQSESIFNPHGGWPGRPTPLPDEGGPGFGAPVPTVTVDAGRFDGTGGLKSTGVDWETGDKYQVTFTKPGTYPMACLVHPGMIGKVVVS
ncbi:MAG TPA: hypothetical protein VHD87_03110 [Acidimicrobiales bacterium]|nr:hypothetical protein [Acidimicrobiales bacterium]